MVALRRRDALGGGAALAAVLLARPSAAQPRQHLRVGSVAAASFATPLYAQELGYFDDAGLAVRIQLLSNTNAVAAAIVGRAIDVGIASVATVANAHARNLPLMYVAPAGLYTGDQPTTALFVRNDAPFGHPHELAGKVIAVATLHDLGQISTVAWFSAAGPRWPPPRFIEMPFSTMARALAIGRIDAAVIAEPFLTLANGQARILGYPYDAIASRFLLGGAVASPRWLAAHAGEARAFAGAIERAAAWGNEHRVEAAAIVARYGKAPLHLLAAMTPPRYATRLAPALVQPVIDAAARFGSIPQAFPAEAIIAGGLG